LTKKTFNPYAFVRCVLVDDNKLLIFVPLPSYADDELGVRLAKNASFCEIGTPQS
jgi:hypothetical protein